ncbi:hypothetical protein NHF40_10915 [Maricaulaceae bacterium EIL42A08]|nr:hypothetical protein [Maricaulaceae bacterium EIL42A08]
MKTRIRHLPIFALGCAALLASTATAQQVIEPDERTELGAGFLDPETAAWNMERTANIAPPEGFLNNEAIFRPAAFMEAMRAARAAAEAGEEPPAGPAFSPLALASTDFAFDGDRIYMGNYHGFLTYDVSSGEPEHIGTVVCPGGQNDVSVFGYLLFMSVESNRARIDCGPGGVEGEVSSERFRGIRIFDISDISNPVQVGAVQTCRGSHTHTIVPDPSDEGVIYIYNSGTSGVRPTEELEICTGGQPEENEETALYSIDVIKVPLAAPELSAIVNRPRIFGDTDTGSIAALWRGGRAGVASQRTAQTNQCHDITVYPEYGLAAGACSGNGILLDISDPENPTRMDDIFDPDMAYWHSANFSNDASKLIFTDEWGGGVGARCTADSPSNWGANIITTLEDGEINGQAYFKLPTVQNETENCVAHNGSLVPVPGRDILAQSWYQGGLSLMDFTDPQNPFEIAYFDQGPVDGETLGVAGYWSAYWHNGYIYASDIARGFQQFRLLPSEHLSEAEIAAAEQVMWGLNNPQTQQKIEWEDTPAVAQAYLDQLQRGDAIDADLAERISSEIERWDGGRPRGRTMRRLAGDLTEAAGEAEGAHAERMTALAGVLERAA